jgi:ABC-type Fe3+-siderophore transport system permease subunit
MDSYSYSSNIGFSFQYGISVLVVIIVCNLLVKSSPNMNTLVVIVAGLLVSYIALYIINNFFPYINQLALSIYQYYAYQVISNYSSMGYMHIWPPILGVLIIFIILLYNRQLG